MPIIFGSGGDKFQDMNISDYKSEHKLRDKLSGIGEESVKISLMLFLRNGVESFDDGGFQLLWR